MRITLGIVSVLVGVVVFTQPARAAGPPEVFSSSVESVTATGANLRGSVDPNGRSATYRFEYLTESAYEANLADEEEAFRGSSWAPASGTGAAGAGTSPIVVAQHITGLAPGTAYRYRLRLVNSAEEVAFGLVRPFGTEAATNTFELLDHRGWEMVSPPDKGGGAVQGPGAIFGGGVFQAAAGGDAMTYSSADSFGSAAQGAAPGSQYLATRGEGGWTSADLTTPLLSGSYGDDPDGVPYQLFSSDLGTALLSDGERCRGQAAGECPVVNPPLPGSGAPAGYRNYYLRTPSGGFESILTAGDLSHTSLGPEQFEMRLVGATPDLGHVVLSTCAALTPDATEQPTCESGSPNLYEWSGGGGLRLINRLGGNPLGTPDAHLAAPSGAISTDGRRVYFTDGEEAFLYLREDEAGAKLVSSEPAVSFQTASSDGSLAFFVKAGTLYRYDAKTETNEAIAGEVAGVLGASEDGQVIFYQTDSGLFRWDAGTVTEVAPGPEAAQEGDWPPATGTARVSADGRYLAFLSGAELTGSPTAGQTEVYLYGPAAGAAGASLVCVSCDPSGEAPSGPSWISGAEPDGSGPGAFDAYKPRVLSASGTRVFFDSEVSLVPQDTDHRTDVYEWEAAGTGTCAQAGGCVQLISTGRSEEASTFLDASADGSDAFFLTSESIYPSDPGSYDVYDARVGGGFPQPATPIPCIGDACQVLPEAPEDPTPGTLVPNSGNPALRVAGETGGKGKARKKKHHGKKAKKKAARK